jgi:hypothetical protein
MWERRRDAIFASRVTSVCPCVVHDGNCGATHAHGHAGGSPCWDWSSIGNQAGLLGSTISIFWAWCRVVRSEQCPIVIHENVCAFPICLVQSALSSMYNISEFIVRPEEQGFHLVTRKRRYLILTHIIKTRFVRDMHSVYSLISCAMEAHTFNRPALPTLSPTHLMGEGELHIAIICTAF